MVHLHAAPEALTYVWIFYLICSFIFLWSSDKSYYFVYGSDDFSIPYQYPNKATETVIQPHTASLSWRCSLFCSLCQPDRLHRAACHVIAIVVLVRFWVFLYFLLIFILLSHVVILKVFSTVPGFVCLVWFGLFDSPLCCIPLCVSVYIVVSFLCLVTPTCVIPSYFLQPVMSVLSIMFSPSLSSASPPLPYHLSCVIMKVPCFHVQSSFPCLVIVIRVSCVPPVCSLPRYSSVYLGQRLLPVLCTIFPHCCVCFAV